MLAAGIGTTHIMPGWLGILGGPYDVTALGDFAAAHPAHPYALAGLGALDEGLAALRALCEPAGVRFVSSLGRNMQLPTALGALLPAAFAPESVAGGDAGAAGDAGASGAMLIAGPAGWRDFYPSLAAGNLERQGMRAEAFAFELPEIHAVKFDNISPGLARLFDRADVRERVAKQVKARLNGAARVGLPAVLGLNDYPHSWEHLQDLIGAPVFEIPTLPPSVPGMRLYNIFKNALARAGVQVLINMPVERVLAEGGRVNGVAVKNVVRETVYRAQHVILATGGLYGGGIVSDHHGSLREAVLGLPVRGAPTMSDWFGDTLLAADHPIHYAGLAADGEMRPLGENGEVAYENVRVVGRALAGYNAACEGSAEGVWIATAYAAAKSLLG